MSVVEKINSVSSGRSFIIALCLVGGYWSIMYDDGGSIERRINTLKAEIHKSKTELESLKRAEEDARRYKVTIEKQGETLSRIIQYMPEKFSDYDLMGILSNEAKAAGANISNITTSGGSSTATTGEKVFEEIAIQIELEATYTQILMFLSYITKTDKVITMKSMSFSKVKAAVEEDNVLVKFQGTFVGYRYLGDNKGT